MEPISVQWAAQINGQVIGSAVGEVTSVCIDSRQAKPGALFFALKGENSDGHEYVAQALKAGAVAAVVERKIEGLEAVAASGEKTGAQIVVPAALRALGDLARHYRRQFAIPIIGITGSVGKTSTKEMIAAVLRTTYNTLASEKNYNNEIGVPLTLFNLNKTHEVAVVEMGMRGLGQIDYLAEIAEPTIGVITNIGSAHRELLGSSENIARAKSELFARLPANGIAILPRNIAYPQIVKASIPPDCRIIQTGGTIRDSEVRLMRDSLVINAQGTASFRVRVGSERKSRSIHMQAVGLHLVWNALLTLAVGYALNVPSEQAANALSHWQGAEGRMSARRAPNDITVLDDCYNASPESMYTALHTLEQMSHSRVAVLGDMRELGDYARQAHTDIGSSVAYHKVRLLVTVGGMAAWIADDVDKRQQRAADFQSVRFHDAREAAAHIKELVKPGDTVLVKGSRAMGMEVIVNALMGENDGNLHA